MGKFGANLSRSSPKSQFPTPNDAGGSAWELGVGRCEWLERPQEGHHFLLVGGAEPLESILRGRGLPGVSVDRVVHVLAERVMHEAAARAQSPERRRSNRVARRGAAVLHDAIPGTHVMQHEI